MKTTLWDDEITLVFCREVGKTGRDTRARLVSRKGDEKQVSFTRSYKNAGLPGQTLCVFAWKYKSTRLLSSFTLEIFVVYDLAHGFCIYLAFHP